MCYVRCAIAKAAFLWTGDNYSAMSSFFDDYKHVSLRGSTLRIHLSTHILHVSAGDWVVKDCISTYVVCSPELFDVLYMTESI